MPFIAIDSVLSGSRLRLLWWLGAAVGLMLLTFVLPIGQAYQLAITAPVSYTHLRAHET